MLGFNRRGNKIRPLLDVNAIWKSGSSTYPEMIRIPMEDGRVIRYTIDRKPIAIHTGKNGWETNGNEIIGYRTKKSQLMLWIISWKESGRVRATHRQTKYNLVERKSQWEYQYY